MGELVDDFLAFFVQVGGQSLLVFDNSLTEFLGELVGFGANVFNFDAVVVGEVGRFQSLDGVFDTGN